LLALGLRSHTDIPALKELEERSQWQTADFAHANHPPAVFVPFQGLNITATPGQPVRLHALAADPGHHNLTTLWWQYLEAGTYPNPVKINNANCLDAVMLMPIDAAPRRAGGQGKGGESGGLASELFGVRRYFRLEPVG
jgi:hypothetical protein